MNNPDWQWLKSQCMTWINSKVNDVQATEDLTKLKDEAVNRGFTRMQVSQAIHKCRKIIDEESNIQQHKPAVPEPESAPEPAAPAPTKVDATKRTKQEFQRRTTESLSAVSGLTPSGTRKTGASGGKSIVDGIL